MIEQNKSTHTLCKFTIEQWLTNGWNSRKAMNARRALNMLFLLSTLSFFVIRDLLIGAHNNAYVPMGNVTIKLVVVKLPSHHIASATIW